MAEPTDVDRLRSQLFEVVRDIEPFALEIPDEFGKTIDALIAAVLAEPTPSEWKRIYRASKFSDVTADNEALECAVLKFREIRGAK